MFGWKRAAEKSPRARREEMVERQVRARGIAGEAVLSAMREVPREAFVPENLAEFAYADAPLPIGEGQTISQPYIVALMAELMALTEGFEECEEEVVAMLQDLLEKRLDYAARDGHRFFDAAQYARLIASAERYYRTMY